MRNRKTIRLRHFDYSTPGYYYVTICTHNRKNLFRTCRRDAPCGCPPVCTELGIIAENTIPIIEERFNIVVDKYIIMPNHIHMIIILSEQPTNNTPSIPQILDAYKSLISVQWLKICKQRNQHMGKIWQRSYYERVLRSEQEYFNKWDYIDTNLIRWMDDDYYIAME